MEVVNLTQVTGTAAIVKLKKMCTSEEQEEDNICLFFFLFLSFWMNVF